MSDVCMTDEDLDAYVRKVVEQARSVREDERAATWISAAVRTLLRRSSLTTARAAALMAELVRRSEASAATEATPDDGYPWLPGGP